MAATPENADRPQMHWSVTSQNVRIYSAQSFSRTVEIFSSITDSCSNLCLASRNRLADCRGSSFSLACSRAIQACAVS
jgi:hypothetical protein